MLGCFPISWLCMLVIPPNPKAIWLTGTRTVDKPNKLLTFCRINKQNPCDEKRPLHPQGINPKSAWNLQALRRETRVLPVCPLRISSLLHILSWAAVTKKQPVAVSKILHLGVTKAKLYTSTIYLFGLTFLLLWSEFFFPACVHQMSSRCWQRNRWPVKQWWHTVWTDASSAILDAVKVSSLVSLSHIFPPN